MPRVKFHKKGRWAHPSLPRVRQLDVPKDGDEFEIGEGPGECHPGIAEFAAKHGRATILSGDEPEPDSPSTADDDLNPGDDEGGRGVSRPGDGGKRGLFGRRSERETKDDPLG